MIIEGIHEEVLRALVEQHAAHAGCRCARDVSDCALGPARPWWGALPKTSVSGDSVWSCERGQCVEVTDVNT